MAKLILILTILCRVLIFLLLIWILVMFLDESFFTLLLEYIKVLTWPLVVVLIVFKFKGQIEYLLKRLSSGTLPGGISFNLEKDLKESTALADEVKEEQQKNEMKSSYSDVKENDVARPNQTKLETAHVFKNNNGKTFISTANNRLESMGLKASPSNLDMDYYRDIAAINPALSLSGVRTELEVLGSNLILKHLGSKLYKNTRGRGVYRIILALFDEGLITKSQSDLARSIILMCNSAVHGDSVSYSQAIVVIDNIEIFIKSVDLLSGQTVE